MDSKDIAVIGGILVAWFVLNQWILPWFGVATCMSGSCAATARPDVDGEASSSSLPRSSLNPIDKEKPNMTELSDGNFETEVLQSSEPVLVDFWAPWCGPCRAIGPIVEELATANAGLVKVGKVNVDENPRTAANYGISSIPTLMIFKNGRPVERLVGVQPKSRIQTVIDQVKE